jgi:putative flippase GtrA
MAVGFAGTLLDLLFFALVTALTGNYVLARAASYLAGSTWAFLLNRKWVFRAQTVGFGGPLRFLTTYTATGLFAVALQFAGASMLGPEYAILVYLATLVTAAMANYLLLKYWVFS